MLLWCIEVIDQFLGWERLQSSGFGAGFEVDLIQQVLD